MVSGGVAIMNVHNSAYLLEISRREARSIVEYLIFWRSVLEDPIINECLADFCRVDAFEWNHLRQLGKTILDHEKILIYSQRSYKFCKDVDEH